MAFWPCNAIIPFVRADASGCPGLLYYLCRILARPGGIKVMITFQVCYRDWLGTAVLSYASRLCTLLQPSPYERLTLCLPYSRQLTVLYQILRPGLSYGHRSPRAHHAAPSWYSELRCIPGKKNPKDQAWDQGCDLRFIGTVSATTELHWLVAWACLERRLLSPCVFSSRF